MTSKNLFFKLMKEDLKSRLWAVTMISLGFFFLFPVTTAFEAGQIDSYSNFGMGLENYTKWLLQWLSFQNGMTVFVMVILAMICGLSSFSYLNSKSKVDFYHSLPVRRELLYAANYIDGILITAIPYVIFVVLAAAVGVSNGASSPQLWSVVLKGLGLHLTYFILMYTVVVIAAMMTGHLVVGVLGSMVFAFYIPLAVALVQGFFGVFFETYVWQSGEMIAEIGMRISPVVEYIYQVDQQYQTQDGRRFLAVLIALAITAVLAAAGLLLYKKRPSEAAGKAMAFAATRPVIRMLIVILSGLGLGSFFWSLRESIGWAVFGVLCGTIISHCVIEIIYHFDFKRLFSNKFQMAVCGVLSLAVLFVFRYDLFGYDRYLPAKDQIESAAVSADQITGWVSYGKTEQMQDGTWYWNGDNSSTWVYDHMKYRDVDNLTSLAAFCVDYTERKETRDRFYRGDMDGTQVTICYTLRSGRQVYRTYYVPIEDILPQLESMYADQDYQQGSFPLMTKSPEQVAAVRYRDQAQSVKLDRLSAEEKKELLTTYQREWKEFTLEQGKTEYPVGLIRFTSDDDEAGIAQWQKRLDERMNSYPRYYSDEIEDGDYYPVYASFTETAALLEAKGIATGNDLKNMKIDSIIISRKESQSGLVAADAIAQETVMYEGEATEEFITITDPEEIAELKEVLVFSGRHYYNQMYQAEDMNIEVYADRGENAQNEQLRDRDTFSYMALMPKGTMPDFVAAKFQEN